MFLLTCDQKLAKSQCSPTHTSTKRRQQQKNAVQYGVCEGIPVKVQWAGEDLWWKGFVEQVSFKSGIEERGSDGWCDGGDRWWTRLTEWSRKIIPKTGWCIPEWAICDFERGRWRWTSNDDERWGDLVYWGVCSWVCTNSICIQFCKTTHVVLYPSIRVRTVPPVSVMVRV